MDEGGLGERGLPGRVEPDQPAEIHAPLADVAQVLLELEPLGVEQPHQLLGPIGEVPQRRHELRRQ